MIITGSDWMYHMITSELQRQYIHVMTMASSRFLTALVVSKVVEVTGKILVSMLVKS